MVLALLRSLLVFKIGTKRYSCSLDKFSICKIQVSPLKWVDVTLETLFLIKGGG